MALSLRVGACRDWIKFADTAGRAINIAALIHTIVGGRENGAICGDSDKGGLMAVWVAGEALLLLYIGHSEHVRPKRQDCRFFSRGHPAIDNRHWHNPLA